MTTEKAKKETSSFNKHSIHSLSRISTHTHTHTHNNNNNLRLFSLFATDFVDIVVLVFGVARELEEH